MGGEEQFVALSEGTDEPFWNSNETKKPPEQIS